jgi:hypothetical protein
LIIVLSALCVGSALVLIAGTRQDNYYLEDTSINDIISAFSETDRASQVLSKVGGLSLVGRDYQVVGVSNQLIALKNYF